MTYHLYPDQYLNTTKIEKPWGYEIIWAHNKKSGYVSKILFITNGNKTSKQFHKFKEETIYILSGLLTLIIIKNNIEYIYHLKEGSSFHIEANMIHRFYAENGDVKIIETSTDHLDDVIRLEDEYGRC
jgi:mannose-6-phosphate isomerase